MVRKIIWNEKATLQFQLIQDYLERTWGEPAVAKFTLRVFDFLDLLEKYPFVGTVEYEKKDIRGFVISSQTRLLYKVTDDAIILLGFIDTRSEGAVY